MRKQVLLRMMAISENTKKYMDFFPPDDYNGCMKYHIQVMEGGKWKIICCLSTKIKTLSKNF